MLQIIMNLCPNISATEVMTVTNDLDSSSRGVLATSSFPPAKWSVYRATLLNEPRTNNRVEGWHFEINMFLKVTHPGIYQFSSDLTRNSFTLKT